MVSDRRCGSPFRGVSHCNGFTLIEVMVAGVLALMLSAAVLSILFQSQAIAGTLLARVHFNAEARSAFFSIANGRGEDTNSDGVWDQWHDGLRGSAVSTAVSTADNRVAVAGGKIGAVSAVSVQCTGVSVPHPECSGSGASVELGSAYELQAVDDATVVGTVTVDLQLLDPYYMKEKGYFSPAQSGVSYGSLPREMRERYRLRFMRETN